MRLVKAAWDEELRGDRFVLMPDRWMAVDLDIAAV